MKIKQMLQRLESTSEIGVARAVGDLIFEPIRDSHLAVPALKRIFEKTTDDNLKIDCLNALGKIGSDEALRFVRSYASSNSPHLLYGAALGLAQAGRIEEASTIYFKLLNAEDEQSVNYAQSFASFFPPTEPLPVAPDTARAAESPPLASLPPLDFEDGVWTAEMDLHQLGASVPIEFCNSTAQSGPDAKQAEVLANIRNLTSSRWQEILAQIAAWELNEEQAQGLPTAGQAGGQPAIDSIIIPRQWSGFEGTFAIILHSDVELEHGIEAFVFPDGRLKIQSNESTARKLYWHREL